MFAGCFLNPPQEMLNYFSLIGVEDISPEKSTYDIVKNCTDDTEITVSVTKYYQLEFLYGV